MANVIYNASSVEVEVLPKFPKEPPEVHPTFTTVAVNFYWTFFEVYAITGLIFLIGYKFKFPSYSLLLTSSETVFYFLTFILLSPVILFCITVNSLIRAVMTAYFYISFKIGDGRSGKIELMSGSDGFWAYDEFANSCNGICFLVMEGECDLAKIQNRFETKMLTIKDSTKEACLHKYRKIPVTRFGYSCWQEDLNFDMKNHIRYLDNENPFQAMTETELFQLMQERMDHPLPNDLPKWRFLVVHQYIYDDPAKANKKYYAMLIPMHHSYMDGISGAQMIQTTFADSNPVLAVDPYKPTNVSFGLKVLAYLSVFFLGPRTFFRTLLLNETNCFHPAKRLTGPKSLGWSKPIRLDSIKPIRQQTNCTTTSIFISSIAGALKTVGIKKGLQVPKMIHTFPTVAMLPYPDRSPQNRFTVALLPTSMEASNLNRLKSTRQALKTLESGSDFLLTFLTMKISGLFPAFATEFISNMSHATILITNIPGPVEACTFFSGSPWVDVSAWAPVRFGTGIACGFLSYRGKVRAGIVADATCLSEPDKDVAMLIQEFEKEVLELCLRSGVSEKDVFAK